jgi:hypothetical protein
LLIGALPAANDYGLCAKPADLSDGWTGAAKLLALFYDIGNLVALGVDDDDLAIAYKKLVGPQSRDLL